ncbi:MAG TPA: hypothetical protein VH165_24870 [Kofleriaceae bacterium]|nr:hypothetical protein [Kofleriaceae bacterium]
MLNIDDHHAALGLFARRGNDRMVIAVPLERERKLDPNALALASLFLFLLEDFFNDPGIQHRGPPFAADVQTS